MAIDPLWLQNLDYPARIDRLVFDTLWTEGVVNAGDFQVTESSPTAMTVEVAAGSAVVTGTDQLFQGKYLVRDEAAATLSINVAPGSGQRNDIVVLRVRDSNSGAGVDDDAILEVIPGVPGSPATDPAIPNTAIPLARVRVPSGSASVTSSMIDDLRTIVHSNYDTLADNSVTSGKIANDTIIDADINSAAAVNPSKLGTGTLPSTVTVGRANFPNNYIPNEAVFTIPGILSVGDRALRFYCEQTRTIANVVASVSTAPTGAPVIFDVKKNGATIFTTTGNRPTIAVSTFLDNSSIPDITAVAPGDYFTISVDQIGSTLSGSDAVIKIVFA